MREVLVIVKTYPEISKKHRETVCTAGILKDTRKLIRLYPIRYRYLNGEQKFSKYQWIIADIEKAATDDRPESYTVTPDSLQLSHKIGTKDQWNERCRWILNNDNMFDSVEVLKDHQKRFNTSLGIVKPKEITNVKIEAKTEDELEGSIKKRDLVYQQLDLFEDNDNNLEIIPYRFFLEFICDNKNCEGHKYSILDWEIAQLYRKIANRKDWITQIKDKIQGEIFSPKRETFLFLGNMARRHHIFCILGFFYPPKNRQLSLF
ncbi:MAG: hypothetical protein M0T82_07720 [Desulfobacteraceae bacterium]|nr:hypothetical protein [Desulfobacteraceae bacterium]